jgi:hypothetical protein
MINLLSSAGHDKISLSKGPFFGINASTDRIGLLDLRPIQTTFEQTTLFLAAQGMTRKHQRNPGPLTD